MPSVFDSPKDLAKTAEKRERGKVMQQLFVAPPGMKAGGLGSFIGAFLAYKDVVEKKQAETPGGFDVWLPTQINSEIARRSAGPSPSPRRIQPQIQEAKLRLGGARSRKKSRVVPLGLLNLSAPISTQELQTNLG